MSSVSLAAVFALVLVAAPPVAAAEPTAAPAATAPDDAALPFGVDPDSWVGDEDLILTFQSVAALGAASLVGGLALVPAYGAFFVVVIMSLASQSPGLLIAAPAAMLAATVLLQALAAGVSVWLISRASEDFVARTYVPSALRDVIKERIGLETGSGFWSMMLGLPWLTGFAGYLVGALLGLAAGVTVAAPMIGAGLVLSQEPPNNVPGVFALITGLMVGLTVVALMETLVAPPVAAMAHHLTKVALDDVAASR